MRTKTEALANNLVGLESLIGLPGTVGGAVYGNAGVPGCEISHFLQLHFVIS